MILIILVTLITLVSQVTRVILINLVTIVILVTLVTFFTLVILVIVVSPVSLALLGIFICFSLLLSYCFCYCTIYQSCTFIHFSYFIVHAYLYRLLCPRNHYKKYPRNNYHNV